MAELYGELLRIIGEQKRRRRLREQREAREAPVIEEERRVAAWMDVPEWRTFWDEEAQGFKVPGGWPPGHVREPERAEAPEPEPEPSTDTFMHRMLQSTIKARTGA